MATIAKTRITTNDPLSICTGLPIWPSLGTLKIGMSSASTDLDYLVKSRPKILFYRFTADLYYGYMFGICGPAFALGMDLEGETSGNSLSLKVSHDELDAGMAAGMRFGFGAKIEVEHYRPFKGWKDDLKLGDYADFDIIGLFISAIKWAMGKANAEGDADPKPFPNVKGYYDLTASRPQSFGYTPTAVAEPKIYVPIDVVPEIEELEAVNAALHALCGDLSMGPDIWFGIPVTVQIAAITLDDTRYTGITPSGNGKLTGTTTGTPPAAPSKMQVELSHTAGFDFGVGIYAEVKVLRFFSLRGSYDISLLERMGIQIHGDAYTNILKADIGTASVAAASSGERIETAGLRVVLDPANA